MGTGFSSTIIDSTGIQMGTGAGAIFIGDGTITMGNRKAWNKIVIDTTSGVTIGTGYGQIQISDEGAIKEVVMKILENNPQSIIDYKAGKDRALGFLVGQAMKETKGKANPKMLNEMFLEELNK